MNPNYFRGKQAQQLGEFTQALALAELQRQGATVFPIATPVKVIRGRAVRTAKVSGDIQGWWPGKIARALLCEVKARTRPNDDGSRRFKRPARCDFEDHQLANMKRCDDEGGTGLVAYMSDSGVLIEPGRNWYAQG